MATFKSEFIGNGKKERKNILIPSIQRNYVQGMRDDVINPFLDKLISALKNKNETLELNYIYGYTIPESNDFIPIDGQQRLTTLWLLYLYLFNEEIINFPELKFYSREFADDFCHELREKIKDYRQTKDICFELKNSDWFISSWQKDKTVISLLNTLSLINKKLNGEKITFYTENVSFRFLDMKEKNLSDDIYIKMNGRGRPLDYIENLKSWLDEQIIKLELNKEIDWQEKFDNDWTQFFWENRNKNQNHPEDISDEQVRLFYSLIYLFWKSHFNEYVKILENIVLSDVLLKELLLSFLELSENTKSEDIASKLFTLLFEEEKLIPLFWIEKLDLFNKESIIFVYKAMNKFLSIYKSFNDKFNKKYFFIKGKKQDKFKTTNIYDMALGNIDYSKMAFLYSLIQIPEKYLLGSDFKNWIRIFRNLIENTNIEAKNLAKILDNIKSISEKAGESEDSFYGAFSEIDFTELNGFNKKQIREEIEKIQEIKKQAEISKKIEEMETFSIFNGAIRFLYRNADNEIDWSDFENKVQTAKKYFLDEGDVAIKPELHMQFLKCFFDNFKYWGQLGYEKYYFENNPQEWIKILVNETNFASVFHYVLLESKSKEVDDFKSYETGIIQSFRNKEFIKFCIENNKYARLRWYGNTNGFYPYGYTPGGNDILFDSQNYYRNELLYSFEEKGWISVNEKNKIKGVSGLYRGLNINFIDNENNNYQWFFDDNKIYLLEKTTKDYIEAKNSTPKKQKWICISTKTFSLEMTQKEFLNGLGELIKMYEEKGC